MVALVVNPTPELRDRILQRMEDLSYLSEAQRLALDKLTALVGIDQINHIVAQGPEELQARLEAFMRYEATLIGQVHDHVASAMPTRYIPISEV